MLDNVWAWVQANPILVAAGAAIFVVLNQNGSLNGILARVWEVLKKALAPNTNPGTPSTPVPSTPVDQNSPVPFPVRESPESIVLHFLAIKFHCKDCSEAQAALKELWKHLEPGHVVEVQK